MKSRLFLPILFVLLLAAPAMTSANDQPQQRSWLQAFNETMFSFNSTVWGWVHEHAPSTSIIPASAAAVLPNVFQNWINEPITALSWAVAGDYGSARGSLYRFGINSTLGILGARDVATAQGVIVPPIDMGLALCARGVGEGANVVLPFVGPRTVRDGLADFLTVNAMTYLVLAPVIGFPPSPRAFLAVELGEEVLRVAVMRQIDHADDLNPNLAGMSADYLASRRARCQQVVERVKSL